MITPFDWMHGELHDDSRSAAFMLDKLHTWKEKYDMKELKVAGKESRRE